MSSCMPPRTAQGARPRESPFLDGLNVDAKLTRHDTFRAEIALDDLAGEAIQGNELCSAMLPRPDQCGGRSPAQEGPPGERHREEGARKCPSRP